MARSSMGRQRIEMRYIECKAKRQVTFSKRRAGIFKKAAELSTLCGAHVAVVVFSEAGNSFDFGSPSVDAVLCRYAPARAPSGGGEEDGRADAGFGEEDVDAETVAGMRRAVEEAKAETAAEQARVSAVGEKVSQVMGGRTFLWEADVEALGEAELPEFARALVRLRDGVHRHAERMLAEP